jgi:hypothetical protein
MKEEIFALLDEMIQFQRKTLLNSGRGLIPTLTLDDILQPNDYPELEYNPAFRYEEGVLAGMQTIQTALYAFFKEKEG